MATNPVAPHNDNRRTGDELGELRRALPPDAVMLAPSNAVPLRAPEGAWGLVIIAIRTTRATGIPDLVFGRWLAEEPPASLHTGDVVVRLRPPTSTSSDSSVVDRSRNDGSDPSRADTDADAGADVATVADVEVLTAHHGGWHTASTWRTLGPQWPHELAVPLLATMRALADAAFNAAQWAALTEPVAAALTKWLRASRGTEPAGATDRLPDRVPDTLAALIDAGLLTVGGHLVLAGHTATIGHGGVLHHGPPYTHVSAVSALATSLTGITVNGWHLWRRAHDHRLLADLRTELATR